MKKVKEGQFVRVTVRVLPNQDKFLKQISKQTRTSISQIIRNLIEKHYEQTND